MTCPECGKAELRFQEADSIETHGLEYGPYEHFHDGWWKCSACNARFTAEDLEAT